MKLSEVPQGLRVRIKAVNIEGELRERILGLGFVPGCEITVGISAPLGNPRMYIVGGKMITLRDSEANMIEVEPVGVCTLEETAEGETYVIESIWRGRNFSARMRKMGIRPGMVLKVLSKHPHVTVETIEGARISLKHGEARKIMVSRRERHWQ